MSHGPTYAKVTQPPCLARSVKVGLFGDSTMAGYEGGRKPSALAAHTPAIALQAILDARFGRGAVVVVSRGVSGTTAAQLVDGTDGLNRPWPQSVDADVIVINHGINDMQAHEDLATYRSYLRFFAANTAGAQVVFETPNKVTGFGVDSAPYAEAMRDVADEFGLPIADTNALTLEQIMLGDWAHPSDGGYLSIVALSLAPAVVPLVARLRCPG